MQTSRDGFGPLRVRGSRPHASLVHVGHENVEDDKEGLRYVAGALDECARKIELEE